MNIKYIKLISIAAISLLFVVQVYVINTVWNIHDENIKLQYHTLATEALNEWNYSNSSDVLDTTFAIMDNYSLETIIKLSAANNRADSLKVGDVFAVNTSKIISVTEHISTAIETYFDNRDLLSSISDSIDIYQLSLVRDDGQEFDLIDKEPIKSHHLIPVNTFVNETDYYKISLNYYMNIENMNSMIIKKAWLTIILTLISSITVCYIFILTYRNFAKEKRLSDMKTDFINNMTHELKTPLSTIAVATRALELAPIRQDENRVLEKAKLIGRQNSHLNGLINKLIDVNMWEREEFTLELESVDIKSLLNDIIESFKSGNENAVTINYCYDTSNCNLLIDRLYFTILINNLLTNAVKYCNISPVIEISTRCDDGRVEVVIKDNGIGINSADIDSVFDKFYRVKQGDIHNVKGLGLGLFYAKRIVEGHGGAIIAKSRVGEGTQFQMIFNLDNR